MQTIGHHTCSKKSGKEYILTNAPFLAVYNERTDHQQFLGTGYYLWDDNIEMAHKWGQDHYRGSYFIIGFTVIMRGTLFLDLVGNRSHMLYFMKVADKYKTSGYARDSWSLGSFIEHLKLLEKDKPGIFPFKIIRAVDMLPRDEHSKWYFVSGKRNYTMLNPRIVICIVEEKDLFLSSKEVVFESKDNF